MSFRNLQHFATLGLTECKDALVRIFKPYWSLKIMFKVCSAQTGSLPIHTANKQK